MTTVAQRVERVENEIRGVASQYGVTAWETDFLRNVKGRSEMGASLSTKQEKTLRDIEAKVFGEEDDDNG